MSRDKIISTYIVVALIGIFVYHALSLSFTQDDAFISYRYAQNYLDGEGLVFNPDERVEGYTNFFFVILLILFGRLGLDYILISKIIGVGAGAGIIVLIYLWSKELFREIRLSHILYFVPVTVMIAANAAFAYWAISGLETTLFSFLILWGLFLALKKNMLMVPILALAALTRPEGNFVFVLIVAYLFISREIKTKKLVEYIVLFALLIIPQVVFRIFYYGDLLPNPFYAKTGWSIEYFLTGLEYVWSFLKHYGFYGALFILPLIIIRQLPRILMMPFVIALVYTAYIIMVGGDVLYGYRFFVPLIPIFYLIFAFSLYRIGAMLSGKRHSFIIFSWGLLLIIGGSITYFGPMAWIKSIRSYEIGLVDSMTFLAGMIKDVKDKQYTIACTTIGAFGYYSDAIIIDMLGLTDRTIAKNPKPVEGILSTWKEQNYNIPYLMEREPDLILFSTGVKPSAPAEKALFLSSKFRKGYYPVFHDTGVLWIIYRRKANFSGEDRYFINAGFVNDYAMALTLNQEKKYDLAFDYASRSLENGPLDFYLPLVLQGEIMAAKKEYELGVNYFIKALDESDGYATIAAHMLAQLFEMSGDSATADIYYRMVFENNRIN